MNINYYEMIKNKKQTKNGYNPRIMDSYTFLLFIYEHWESRWLEHLPGILYILYLKQSSCVSI